MQDIYFYEKKVTKKGPFFGFVFSLQKCPGPVTQVPIYVEGWNFQGLFLYARRVNPENFSLLAESEGVFWPQSLSVKINSAPL